MEEEAKGVRSFLYLIPFSLILVYKDGTPQEDISHG